MNERIIHFDLFLGKSIKDLLELDNIEIQNLGFSEIELSKLNSTKFILKNDYLGVFLHSIQAWQNNDKIIQSIFLYSTALFDKSFYNKFLKIYGNENIILKKDKVKNEVKSQRNTNTEFEQRLTKRVYSMNQVSFDDQPDLVLWNIEDYKIEMRFDYDNSISMITFRNLN